MTINPGNLSRQEASVDARLSKRYRAAIRKRGICCACVHREVTLGVYHCKGQPAWQRGMCSDDRHTPSFALDDLTLEEFRDAA